MTAFGTGGNVRAALWPSPPCDHLPELHDLRTKVTGLEAQVRSLTEQLHRKEALATRYRHIDEAADVLRQQHRGDTHGCCITCRTDHPCRVRRDIDPEETTS